MRGKMRGKYSIVAFLLSFAMILLSACSSAAKLTEYELGDDKVSSINAVLGEDRKVAGVSTGKDNDVDYKQYTYESSSVMEDLIAYATYLQDNGWIATMDVDFSATSGEAQFGIPSVDEGKILIISIAFDNGKYAIRFNKLEGELTMY